MKKKERSEAQLAADDRYETKRASQQKQFIACNAIVQSGIIEKPNDPESKKRYQRAKETWSYFATVLSDDSLIKLTKDIINSH